MGLIAEPPPPRPSVKPRLECLRVDADVAERLADLHRSVFGFDHPHGFWEWKHLRNPAGGSRAVLAADPETNALLGSVGIMRQRVSVAGRQCAGGQLVDVMVRPEWRRSRLFLRMAARHLDLADRDNLRLVVGLTRRHTTSFATRKGYRVVCGVPRLGLPCTPVSWALTLARSRDPRLVWQSGLAILRHRLRLLAPSAPGIQIEEVYHFGNEFDVLWRELPHERAIEVVRDAPYLTWRFLRCPGARHVVLAARRRGTLLGYVVVRVSLPRRSHSRARRARVQGRIMHLTVRPGEEAVARDLAVTGVQRLLHERVTHVDAWALPHDSVHQLLRDVGFWEESGRAERHKMWLVVRWSGPMADTFLDETHWRLMAGDTDEM